jgi:hypothetical protein
MCPIYAWNESYSATAGVYFGFPGRVIHLSVQEKKEFVPEYRVYLKCSDKLQWLCAPHQNSSYRYMSANSFRGKTQTLFRTQSFRFLSVGHLKTLAFSSPIEMKRYFTNAYFMLVRLFVTSTGRLKGCDSPWLDVSMHALIQLEDILRICCDLWWQTIRTQQLLNWEGVL